MIGGDASYLEDHVKKAQELYGTIKIEELLSKMGRNQSWEGYRGDLLIYDNKTDRWTTSNLKLRKRAYNTLNYHNNKLYVLGGKRLSINRKYEYLDDKIEMIHGDIKNSSDIYKALEKYRSHCSFSVNHPAQSFQSQPRI